MPIVKQLSIFLANQPGALSEVCSTLSAKKINIKALAVSDTVDHAVVRFVLSDPVLGQEVLEDANLLVVDNRVLEIPLASKPGALAHLAGELAKAKINIEYAYGSTSPDGKGILYLRVRDPEAAEKIVSGAIAKIS